MTRSAPGGIGKKIRKNQELLGMKRRGFKYHKTADTELTTFLAAVHAFLPRPFRSRMQPITGLDFFETAFGVYSFSSPGSFEGAWKAFLRRLVNAPPYQRFTDTPMLVCRINDQYIKMQVIFKPWHLLDKVFGFFEDFSHKVYGWLIRRRVREKKVIQTFVKSEKVAFGFLQPTISPFDSFRCFRAPPLPCRVSHRNFHTIFCQICNNNPHCRIQQLIPEIPPKHMSVMCWVFMTSRISPTKSLVVPECSCCDLQQPVGELRICVALGNYF